MLNDTLEDVLEIFNNNDYNNYSNTPIDSIGIREIQQQLIKAINDEVKTNINVQIGGARQYVNYYEMEIRGERLLRKFNHTATDYVIRFKNLPPDILQVNDIMYNVIESLLETFFQQAKRQHDLVALSNITICHPSMEYPINFSYMPKNDLTTELIISKIARVCQSKKSLKLDASMNFIASVINCPQGSGFQDLKEYTIGVKSIITIWNNDNYCGLRAIIIGMAFADWKYLKEDIKRKAQKDINYNDKEMDLKKLKKYDRIYKRMYRRGSKELNNTTEEYVQAIGLPDMPLGLKEIFIIEEYIQNYQVTVFGDQSVLFKRIYQGQSKEKQIFLFLHDNHYDLLTKVNAFYGKRFYCDQCDKYYNSQYEKHPCNHVCKVCSQRTCVKSDTLKCPECNVVCQNKDCLEYHMGFKCEKQVKCETCGRYMNSNNKDMHICHGRYCGSCEMQVEDDHKCYILTENEKELKKRDKIRLQEEAERKRFENNHLKKGHTIITPEYNAEMARQWNEYGFQKQDNNVYVFFDYECMVEEYHIPNLVVASQICESCINKQECNLSCKVHHFFNNNDFCNWLFSLNADTIAIAHNLSYDGFFVMKYIMENRLPNSDLPSCLINGGRLLSIKFKGIKIIDSYNFMPLALSKLPKTFGLNELHKGYFPYLINTKDNQNKIFPSYPEIDYYGVKYMQPKQRDDFLKWYNENKHKQFNLQQELLDYCISDVDILQRSCLLYRQLFMKIADIDPFRCGLTIASVCHLTYRKFHMPSKTIAIIPEQGLNPHDNYSYKQLLWIRYLSKQMNIRIQHAGNGGEKRIRNYKLDGYDPLTDTGYEFHGCVFHGCPKCYSPSTFNTIKRAQMGYIYKIHCERINYLKSCLNNLVEIWECEWNDLVKNDMELRKFCKNQDIRPPLNPRDSLFGGRTNSACLYYKCKEDEQIKYYDFTSVYPSVMKVKKYPVDFPKVITENFDVNFNNYFGIVQCVVLPPRGIRFPVLPARINGKLIFTLCNQCASDQSSECTHSNDERKIEGTWVTEEVKKALEHDYIIIKIYSVWHFEKSLKYDENRKCGGLFTSYVNKFLKMKTEAAGFPSHIKTNEQKQKYVDEFYKHEGIKLDIKNIQPNPGLKAISKLCLNSLWGRFGLNTNKTQCAFVTGQDEFYNYVIKDNYDIHQISFYNDSIAQIFYTNNHQLHEGSFETNIVIAAFTTCYARLKLLDMMEKLDDRVLYFDTDSCVFISRQGEYEPPLGDFLGDLTNEIETSDGDYIEEGVFPGPKNYAYVTNIGKTTCKLKGFTLNWIAGQKVNFQSMKNMIQNIHEKHEIPVEQNVFKRDKKTWNVKTEVITKMYKHIYDKRVVLDDLTTKPYGY